MAGYIGKAQSLANLSEADTLDSVTGRGATTTNNLDVGTVTSDGLTVAGNVSVDGGTIKLDGNYPVGSANVALGDGALDDGSLSGGNNTALGSNALTSNTTGGANVAVGAQALQNNTTGTNIAIGFQAGYTNTTGTGNIYMGESTGRQNSTGNNNVGIGAASLYPNTGSSNTAVGAESLRQNTTASNNTAVGYQSLYANTTASNNTAVGYLALGDNTTGDFNTAIGRQAGDANTTGTYNTFLGSSSGYFMTTGSKNTILGRYNGNQGNLDIRTSNNNIVLSDGDGNPRLNFRPDAKGRFGNRPSYDINSNLSSLGNVMMGQFGGTFGDNHFITNVGAYTGQYDHWKLYNGNGLVGRIYTTGSSTVFSTSSDYRLKENVVNINGAINRVKQLNPSRFNFIADPNFTLDGFLAHEVQEIIPEAVCGEKDAVDENGNIIPQGIDQSKIVPLLTAALKEAITEIESLKERVATLENA